MAKAAERGKEQLAHDLIYDSNIALELFMNAIFSTDKTFPKSSADKPQSFIAKRQTLRLYLLDIIAKSSADRANNPKTASFIYNCNQKLKDEIIAIVKKLNSNNFNETIAYHLADALCATIISGHVVMAQQTNRKS